LDGDFGLLLLMVGDFYRCLVEGLKSKVCFFILPPFGLFPGSYVFFDGAICFLLEEMNNSLLSSGEK
jgi:hypothetical protein